MTDEAALFRTDLPGRGWVAYDPWRVDRLLATELAGRRLASLLGADGVRSPDLPTRAQAEELLLAAARAAFGLPEVTADGAPAGQTEATVRRVLREFVDWQAGLKKNSA